MTLTENTTRFSPIVHLTYFTDDDSVIGIPPYEESIRQYFPGYSIKVWSISEVRKELAAARETDLLECFDRLIPFAYKSDLASYFLLKKYGGWYTDLNNKFVAPPPSVTECTMYLFKDVHDEPAPWSISTSIFYAQAESPALSKALELVIENCQSQKFGNTPLCVTGPTVFGSAIATIGLAPGVNYHTGEFVYHGDQKVFTTREKELFALYKPHGLGHGDSGVRGGNNYSELWWERRIYSSD